MPRSEGEKISSSWEYLLSTMKHKHKVGLRGESLSIPEVVAVARYRASVDVDSIPAEVVAKIDRSVDFLRQSLDQGLSVYGVNTGFGGSADTSTTAADTLQVALLQMQLCAVLPVAEKEADRSDEGVFPYQTSFSDGDDVAKLAMPQSWVRGAMLVRCNSLLRGHSAVRLDVIKKLLGLLEHDLVPLVPLRGSISASGDLCPLSYIAGALEGNPDVRVWTGASRSRKLLPANEALASVGIAPVRFGPKEILGLLNGTAFSASVASIAHHQADLLSILAQILTAMGVEALLGTVESFDPFIAAVRPHAGQHEVAKNIRAFLKDSKLARAGDHSGTPAGLRQDRYALRTSSQWIGPVLEDMSLARRQVEIELNSTTDNPLIDAEAKHIFHGGNFQAASVTSSTEKTRSGLEKIGKMLFAQSSELLDNRLAHNLPPNLAADEPSLSYSLKGVDINMASYMSELAFLANPVGNHVQSAEMSNQSINSLALISARYTHMAVDLVSLMSSAYLYCLCQALDIRAMDARFMETLRPGVRILTTRLLGEMIAEEQLADLHRTIWETIEGSLAATTCKDSTERFTLVANSTQHILVKHLTHAPPTTNLLPLTIISTYTTDLALLLRETFLSNRVTYLANPDAMPYLGRASRRMYSFVRRDLGVPMHRGIVDHPNFGSGGGKERVNTGTRISSIYKALREERLAVPVMECLEEALGARGDERGAKL
ncbi:phenylalanine ammonia-lyase [Diplocarpon rosae]|nr:phenylalanine ammonia-lyase [Diplocarpon rosae]